MQPNSKGNTYFSSLRMALSVLKCFDLQHSAWSGNEIASKCGIHKTTAYRLLAVLAEEGFLERNEDTNKYVISPMVFHLGSIYLSTNNLHSVAEPVVRRMNDLTDEMITLATLDRTGDITFVMFTEPKHNFRVGYHAGLSYPAHCHAVGKALLSELPDAEVDRIYPEERLVPVTKYTVSTKAQLKIDLENARKNGFAENYGEYNEQVNGFAAVVRNQRGECIAAVAIGVPRHRCNEAIKQRFSDLVKVGAGLISYRLGYQDPENLVRDTQELLSWWKENLVKGANKPTPLKQPSPD